MIIKTIEIINNQEHVLTYSDKNKYIKQVETGILYSSALDVATSNYTYEETDIDIEEED